MDGAWELMEGRGGWRREYAVNDFDVMFMGLWVLTIAALAPSYLLRVNPNHDHQLRSTLLHFFSRQYRSEKEKHIRFFSLWSLYRVTHSAVLDHNAYIA